MSNIRRPDAGSQAPQVIVKREKSVVIATVAATFPEFPGGRMNQIARGTGSSPRAAITRAVADLLKNDGVKRKRWRTIQMNVVVARMKRIETENA